MHTCIGTHACTHTHTHTHTCTHTHTHTHTRREEKNRIKMVLDDDELKTNAILIVADTASLDAIGDWVAFELVSKVLILIRTQPQKTGHYETFQS